MDAAHRFDPRYQAAYSLPEAAQYLRIPLRTLRSWLPMSPDGSMGPRLQLPDTTAGGAPLLSFINLVEAHVLHSLRGQYHLTGTTITRAWRYLTTHFPSLHPLAEYDLWTDGRQLFFEEDCRLLTLDADGQLAMRAVFSLQRVERTLVNIPMRLVPRLLVFPTAALPAPGLSCRVPSQTQSIAGSGLVTALV